MAINAEFETNDVFLFLQFIYLNLINTDFVKTTTNTLIYIK